MAQAGWYPDPSGTPATYRYWDGARWSAVTTSDPSSPPPGDKPPPPPPSPGGYGDVPAAGGGFVAAMPPMPATDSGPSGGGHRNVVLIAIAAVLALLLLGVGAFLGVRALTGAEAKQSDAVPTTGPSDDAGDQLVPAPDESDTGPDPGATPPGAAECLRGAPTILDDQAGSDRITGLGVSMPRIDGYRIDPMQSFAFTWAFDFTPQVQTVEEGWASVYGVGGVETAFGDPEQTADAVLQCMTASPLLYSGFESRTDLASEEIDVRGAETAWSLTAEVRVDTTGIAAEGDVVQVIVVDTGDEEIYGLYISVVPIGDKDRIAQQERVAGQLRAE